MISTKEKESGSQPELRAADRRANNFTALRLIAAFFVFAGHMAGLSGKTVPSFGGFVLHELGVSLLFLESGYLITKSWEADPHPLRYALRRFLRLWPPLAVFVLLMAFVAGPLLSELGAAGYFQSGYLSYLRNLRFYTVYSLPGVFSELPYTNAVSPAIWTLPAEAFLYVLTPFFWTVLTRAGKKKPPFQLLAVLTVCACALDLLLRTRFAGSQLVFYGTEWINSYHLAVMYLIGMLYTCAELRRYLNLQASVCALALWAALSAAGVPGTYLLLYLVLPYAAFSFALAPAPLFQALGRGPELTYGIYLYGCFFEQLTILLDTRLGLGLGYLQELILSLLPTLLAAALSYALVERPLHRLTRRLRIRPERTAGAAETGSLQKG